MSHEFLLHADRRAQRIQPRAVGVPKGVLPDVTQPEFPPSGTNVVLLDGTGVIAPAGDLARKNPTVRRLRTLLLPIEQNRSEVRVEGENRPPSTRS
jgi:hypothetical protein